MWVGSNVRIPVALWPELFRVASLAEYLPVFIGHRSAVQHLPNGNAGWQNIKNAQIQLLALTPDKMWLTFVYGCIIHTLLHVAHLKHILCHDFPIAFTSSAA
jgi:hypothetical protein